MIVAVLYGARGSSPAAFFAILFITGLLLVAVALQSRRSRPKRPPISLGHTLIDGKEVTVINRARLDQLVQTLSAPGALQVTKLLGPDSPAWAELAGTFQGSAEVGPDSPFPVIIRVRSALLAQQLDSVRNLLSDQLYHRLSASPPITPVASQERLIMSTNQRSGDDANRIIVRVGGSLAVPGATAEDWTMVRAPQGTTIMPADAPPATASPATASPATTPPEAAPLQPSSCPYCGAQLDKGAKRCRYCGMDVTLAPASVSPILATPSVSESLATPTVSPASVSGWIVDDISAAHPMAA